MLGSLRVGALLCKPLGCAHTRASVTVACAFVRARRNAQCCMRKRNA
jgi:hypothetical protein